MANSSVLFTQSGRAAQVLFFLRFIQQGSLVLTGFVAIYFVYWHVLLKDDVPFPLFVIIATSALTYIESYFSSAVALAQRSTDVDYKLMVHTSGLCSFALSVGYIALRQVPFIRVWCEGDNWFRPTRETQGWKLSPVGVEEHHCALTCVIIAAGAVALAFTLFVSAFAVYGALENRKPKQRGYIVVGDEIEDCEDDDDTIVDGGDVEKR